MKKSEKNFAVGILDPFFTDPFKDYKESSKQTKRISKLFFKFVLDLVLTPFTVAVSVSRIRGTDAKTAFWTHLISMSIFLGLFILLHLVQLAADGLFVFAWIFYIIFCAGVSIARAEIRNHYNIQGISKIERYFYGRPHSIKARSSGLGFHIIYILHR